MVLASTLTSGIIGCEVIEWDKAYDELDSIGRVVLFPFLGTDLLGDIFISSLGYNGWD